MRETETECELVGAEREGGTESEAGSRIRPVSTEPDAGLERTSCEIVAWAKVGRSTDWATQAPLVFVTFKGGWQFIKIHCHPFCFILQALNQLFEKIMALDIDERHLLRLGHGEEELETEKDFSRWADGDEFWNGTQNNF